MTRERKEPDVVYVVDHTDFATDVERLLNASGLAERLKDVRQVLLKPNLVEPKPPPVTTPVECAAAVVEWLSRHAPHCRVIIAEGCGAKEMDTGSCFEALGYSELARLRGVELLDLNTAPSVTIKNPACRRWPEITLPRILFESFLISLPVLKAHTLAGVTLTMKNMMGAPPPAVYQQGGHWKKASFHQGIQEAIFDLNRYRAPDCTILDATIGMSQAHLWGPTCDPPVNLLVAGYDPVAVDAYGCSLLGKEWSSIGHIRMAHGVLGTAEGFRVETVEG